MKKEALFDDDDFITISLLSSEAIQAGAIRTLERIVDVIILHDFQGMNLFHGVEGILDVLNPFDTYSFRSFKSRC